jgi:hypothetical protein
VPGILDDDVPVAGDADEEGAVRGIDFGTAVAAGEGDFVVEVADGEELGCVEGRMGGRKSELSSSRFFFFFFFFFF